MQRDNRSISDLAYQLWESRGRPEGSAEVDWLDAERRLSARDASKAVDEALRETFPASDAPGSHLPDLPPSNADAKWAAAGVERKKPTQRSGTTRRKASSTAPKDNGSAPDR